jgi:hypothetical protein
MQWFPAWIPGPQIFLRELSADKVLATASWDKKGILLVVFLQTGRKIFK